VAICTLGAVRADGVVMVRCSVVGVRFVARGAHSIAVGAQRIAVRLVAVAANHACLMHFALNE